MSLFSIKLKTKAGNDIKKKEIFTCLFRLNYKTNLLTKKVTAEYTYRIMYSGGAADCRSVLEIKNAHLIESIEDLTLKVLLNLCHVIGKLSKDIDANPDFILFLSPDLEAKTNKSWAYLRDVLKKPKKDKSAKAGDKDWTNFLQTSEVKLPYHAAWNKGQCDQMKIKKTELDLLRSFVEMNPNTTFMSFDPNKDKVKYTKSLKICEALQERIDRQI